MDLNVKYKTDKKTENYCNFGLGKAFLILTSCQN